MSIIVYTELSKDLYEYSFCDQVRLLPTGYKVGLRRYKNWQDSQASLFGRLLLKTSLHLYYDYDLTFSDIRYNVYGKPYLKDSKINFNISHSSNLVCCILSREYRVGIDLEKINRKLELSDFESPFTSTETMSIFNAKDKIHSFLWYWTRKEAVLKLVGKGLSISLKSFEVNTDRISIDDKYIFLKEIPLNSQYLCHIASEKPIAESNILIKHIPNSTL